jgi:hypothetical protein
MFGFRRLRGIYETSEHADALLAMPRVFYRRCIELAGRLSLVLFADRAGYGHHVRHEVGPPGFWLHASSAILHLGCQTLDASPIRGTPQRQR